MKRINKGILKLVDSGVLMMGMLLIAIVVMFICTVISINCYESSKIIISDMAEVCE